MPTSSFPPSSFPSGSIERLKREAKAISRDTGVSHSQALDQIAIRHGFTNWSSLILAASAGPHAQKRASGTLTPQPEYPFERDAAQMREATRSRGANVYPTAADVEDLSTKFISPKNSVRYAIAYLELALQAPQYRVVFQSLAFMEMRNHFPYRLHETEDEKKWIVVNREYKPVGNNRPDDQVSYQDFHAGHFEISIADAEAVSEPHHLSSHALYGDGIAPWHSRTAATAYLGRLRKLLTILDAR